MFEAVSADAFIIPGLFGQPFRGGVHSVFATAVNFTDDAGELYCLAATGRDDAPGTVRLRAAGFDGLGLRAGDAVVSVNGVLTCGPLAVKADGIRPWTAALPSFPGEPAGRRRLAANLAALRRVVAAEGRAGGLWAFGAGSPGDGPLARELALRARAFCDELASGRPAASLAAGRRLLGLGVGLTPSGDDFLAGLLLTFRLAGGPFGEEHFALAAALVREAATATGLISRALLRHAAAGRAAAGAVDLLAALAAGGPAAVEKAAGHLLATGATSGTDTALGLAAGLGLGLQLVKIGGITDGPES